MDRIILRKLRRISLSAKTEQHDNKMLLPWGYFNPSLYSIHSFKML